MSPTVLLVAAMVPAALLGQDSQQEEEEPYTQLLNEYFLTGTVYPMGRAEVQITLLPQFEHGREESRSLVPLGAEIGVTDRWQFEVEWSGFVTRDPAEGGRQSSVGDLELSTQYAFMAIGGSDFHATFGFGVTFPTGDLARETTEGFVEYEPSIAVAKDIPGLRGAQLFGQAALGLVQRVKEHDDPLEDEPAAHELTLAAGFMLPVGSARLSTEVNWFTNAWNNGGEERAIFLTPGVQWNLPGTWEVGLGVPIGLTDDAADFSLTLLFLYEFNFGEEGGD